MGIRTGVRITFDAQEQSLPVEIVRTITDPPFLQVIVPKADECKNFPGEILKTTGFFAPVETSIFHHVLKEGCRNLDKNGRAPLVVDVGGNIGYFTAYAAACGCRVISFEPIPKIIRFLNLTVALNGFQNRVEIHQAAVSNRIGKSAASLNCYDTGLSGVNPGGDIDIVMEKLDDVVHEDVLLLKIDTEGYEDVVLRGAQELLSHYRVDNIVCETKKTNDVQYKVDFINRMIDEGYKVSAYHEHYPGETSLWKSKLRESFDFSFLKRLRDVNQADWIPHEDLWYERTEKN
jgi:FkbM family methyltransferase